jgi:hypothetical protein
VIDLVFASTAFSSTDARAQKLGEFFFIDYVKHLYDTHKRDANATSYLDAILPILGSTLRAFAVEKLGYQRRILPLERIQSYEEGAIREHAAAIPLLPAARIGSKWTDDLLSSTMSLGVGAAAVGLTPSSWAIFLKVAVGLVGGSVAIIAASYLTRLWQRKSVQQIVKLTSADLRKAWGESYERYEAALMDCLIASIRVQEERYPGLLTFPDGHLFPRPDLPYLPPANHSELRPSPAPTEQILERLSVAVRSRISINPNMSKLRWLRNHVDKMEADGRHFKGEDAQGRLAVR